MLSKYLLALPMQICDMVNLCQKSPRGSAGIQNYCGLYLNKGKNYTVLCSIYSQAFAFRRSTIPVVRNFENIERVLSSREVTFLFLGP